MCFITINVINLTGGYSESDTDLRSNCYKENFKKHPVRDIADSETYHGGREKVCFVITRVCVTVSVLSYCSK